MSRRWPSLAMLMVLFVTTSCDKEQVAQKPPAQTPGAFGEDMIQTIVPVGNSDAYAISFTGNDVWLLRKDEAVRVKEVPHFSAANKPVPARPFAYQQAPAVGLNGDQR